MARKDERGVVIPAPLQFNNPASASQPRYDDEHRGPAVTDSYELSHCRIDLAERSEAGLLPQICLPGWWILRNPFQRISGRTGSGGKPISKKRTGIFPMPCVPGNCRYGLLQLENRNGW